MGILEKLIAREESEKKKTVVLDAGIVTKESEKELRKNGYEYVVARNNPVTKEEKGVIIKLKRCGKR